MNPHHRCLQAKSQNSAIAISLKITSHILVSDTFSTFDNSISSVTHFYFNIEHAQQTQNTKPPFTHTNPEM